MAERKGLAYLRGIKILHFETICKELQQCSEGNDGCKNCPDIKRCIKRFNYLCRKVRYLTLKQYSFHNKRRG